MTGAAAMARAGAHVIVDDVFLSGASTQQRWESALEGVPELWVGVRCDGEVAAGRETARGDRISGMTRTQASLAHKGVRYDFRGGHHAARGDQVRPHDRGAATVTRMGEPGPTSAFHATNMTPDVSRLVDALDAQAASAGVGRLREWAHRELAARPGERALDVGSGTGSETQALAAAVAPDGSAVGVEPNPGLREVATTRASEAENPATFVTGEASALPASDGEIDIVWCERVFQHLTEPDKAAADIARVLAPGGRVALLDTDWATTILHPGDPAVVEALLSGAVKAAANPYAGRQLVGQLVAAGLEIDDIGS